MQSPRPIDIFTPQKKFEANELPALLEAIREKYPYCEVLIQGQGTRIVHQRIVVFQNGKLAFCGDRTANLDNFVNLIQHKINTDWIDRIFESSQTNLNAEMTPKQFCDRLLQMRVISRTDLLKILLSAFLLALEPFWAGSGQLTVKPLPSQSNLLELDWRIFKAALVKRQSIWRKFSALEQGINSIPIITEAGIQALQDEFAEGSTEQKLIRFIERSVDGRGNLADLARRRNVDPLSLAQKLVKGIEQGWISISDSAQDPDLGHRGNILVIDDNPTTRKLLVTILQEFYNAIPTAGALSTVGLIPQKNIDLVIVSHSVPVATGLQLTRIIRQNPQYQRLPILFISSKENFFDRMKAKMAGVTDYITQPFDRTKMLYLLDYHLR